MQGRISKNAKSSKNSNWKWVDLEIGAIAIMHKYGRFFYLPCTGKNLRISKDKFKHHILMYSVLLLPLFII